MASRGVLRFAGKLPKAGNSPEECEDDFCSAPSRFAIADGASEGSYSSMWAGILARSFCSADVIECQANEFLSWLEQCRIEWSSWERSLAEKELPWFTREKLRDGSFATFLGIAITEGRWHAFACGDACLFVVRNDALLDAFPVEHSQHFDNAPALVPSTRPVPVEALRNHTGEALAGDRLYLASDALACWFLADSERGEKPWVALDGIQSEQDFEIFVSEERQRHTMRNDDVTLVSVELTGA
jgi:hypothetical protein